MNAFSQLEFLKVSIFWTMLCNRAVGNFIWIRQNLSL